MRSGTMSSGPCSLRGEHRNSEPPESAVGDSPALTTVAKRRRRAARGARAGLPLVAGAAAPGAGTKTTVFMWRAASSASTWGNTMTVCSWMSWNRMTPRLARSSSASTFRNRTMRIPNPPVLGVHVPKEGRVAAPLDKSLLARRPGAVGKPKERELSRQEPQRQRDAGVPPIRPRPPRAAREAAPCWGG